MAAKKKTTKKATTKGSRQMRQEGEPLPKMVPSERVLRALEVWEIPEKDFIVEYDKAASPRGRGTSVPSAAQVKAVEDFMAGKLSKQDAMAKADIKTAGAFINLMERVMEAE